MSRFLIALVACAFCVVFAVPAAFGKGDVRARLDTPLPLETAAGKKVIIAWTLSYADRGKRRPFGAGGVFVRLLSASGGKPVKAPGKDTDRGRYVAEVTVPEGGTGGIEIGLEGTRHIGGRFEKADLLFPLDNDPFAATDGSTGNASLWLAVAGLLAALGAMLAGGRAFVSRRRSRLA